MKIYGLRKLLEKPFKGLTFWIKHFVDTLIILTASYTVWIYFEYLWHLVEKIEFYILHVIGSLHNHITVQGWKKLALEKTYKGLRKAFLLGFVVMDMSACFFVVFQHVFEYP